MSLLPGSQNIFVNGKLCVSVESIKYKEHSGGFHQRGCIEKLGHRLDLQGSEIVWQEMKIEIIPEVNNSVNGNTEGALGVQKGW